MADVAVVGGGIVGLAIARELALRGRSVTVLEREDRIAAHQSSHNSGVIHAGVYYRPGSLKARLCREGADSLYAYCAETGVPAERCGKVVVAVRTRDLPRLDELERRARANGVPDLARLGSDDLRAVEPAATGLGALHSPHTGIVDFAAVAAVLAREVEALGGRVLTRCEVSAIRDGPDEAELLTSGGVVRARRAVACAGLESARLAAASGVRTDLRIAAFRGAYLTLRPERADLVRGQIYPVPDPSLPFLGVHLSRTIAGAVLLGPTALPAGLREAPPRLLARWWRAGARELAHTASRRLLVRDLRRYVPAIGVDDVRPGFAGIRAQAVARDGTLLDDFALAETARVLHVLNAPSPAATASLAIAKLVADRLGRV